MADPIIDDLLELMPDEISFQRTTQNGWGEDSNVGSVKKFRGRIVGQKSQVMVNGKTVKSGMHVVIAGTGIQMTDIVTLPARFAPKTSPPIVGIQQSTDENGAHHEVVYF